MKSTKYLAEMTDVINDEPNYAWSKRVVFEAPVGAANATIVRRAKKALEVTDNHYTIDYGEEIRLDLAGKNVCILITPRVTP